ncbi:adenosylcobinamide-GDP ribazoletransferase [Lentzea flaviverrucosa]|uniref:Adenosylcobinamide-GDP ribazoletransferase n=1 Tax=Lentzea flaviverrucosa TaxID=200379 RepID=A0A1H9XMP3_9PSEU|nr:adenosylcobinamide-GDP ribazoletransferase [Lentzea flaviverrucosa]RDI20430.1 cobalamin-5'-phosphate synthase [Lentzea flaviverrucosa]SES47097.1 cobalamin-5'-phosphate synthase [Lentzea flaviverrucosa]
MKLAFSWLTVLPLRVDDVDRKAAGRAIAATPLVGLVLGAFVVGVLELLAVSDVPALVAGFLVVGAVALATRGMHLDGLADVADGLGCYGPPGRALEVMKDGGAGPFGVVSLIVVLGAQAAALPHAHWGVVLLAFATSRAAFGICCLRGVPAARPEGLGALVAGTQHPLLVIGTWVLLAAAAIPLGWRAVVAVVVAFALVWLLVKHTGKRFGGITGDVLGAAAEIALLAVLVIA